MERTTIRLDEHLVIEVKQYALAQGKSFTAVVSEALRTHIARSRNEKSPASKRRRFRLPVSREKGGLLPGVNLNSNAELLDVMQRALPLDKLR